MDVFTIDVFMVDVFMVDDPLQDLKSDTCGIFQLYFYTNLFLPQEDSQIKNNSKLTIKTISTLLNEIFILDILQKRGTCRKFCKRT